MPRRYTWNGKTECSIWDYFPSDPNLAWRPPEILTSVLWVVDEESTDQLTARTEDIRFDSKCAEIAGTLWLPEGSGPFPAIVMGHGSGRSTRSGGRFAAGSKFKFTLCFCRKDCWLHFFKLKKVMPANPRYPYMPSLGNTKCLWQLHTPNGRTGRAGKAGKAITLVDWGRIQNLSRVESNYSNSIKIRFSYRGGPPIPLMLWSAQINLKLHCLHRLFTAPIAPVKYSSAYIIEPQLAFRKSWCGIKKASFTKIALIVH